MSLDKSKVSKYQILSKIKNWLNIKIKNWY